MVLQGAGEKLLWVQGEDIIKSRNRKVFQACFRHACYHKGIKNKVENKFHLSAMNAFLPTWGCVSIVDTIEWFLGWHKQHMQC